MNEQLLCFGRFVFNISSVASCPFVHQLQIHPIVAITTHFIESGLHFAFISRSIIQLCFGSLQSGITLAQLFLKRSNLRPQFCDFNRCIALYQAKFASEVRVNRFAK
jgi:hypothetical protein